MPPDTKITYAIDTLKLNYGNKKCSPEVADSLEQLSSTTRLLETSKLWPEAFQQMSSLFRQSLLPLYKSSPVQTLQYSTAIFTIIHEDKILPAAKIQDDATRGAWERVLISLLSGILDFLEEHPTYDNRTIVGVAIYPTIRTVCDAQTIFSYIQRGSIILHTVYQLLSETVTAHLVNQRKLRGPDYLGGKQMGIIIAQTKDYLTLEALLELFAKLLPSTKSKGGREKRNGYIGEVFNPSTLTCNAEIVHILESISSTDWEHTSTKIVQALARADIAFPQPFETTHFQMRGSKPYSVDRLYVDHTGFVANVDEAGELETFRASYAIIKNIKISSLSTFKTRITLLLLGPPVVGQVAVTSPPDGEPSVSFDIQSKDVAAFIRSLNARGLKDVIARNEPKLSKPVTHLDLDFDKKDVPISTQDKVQNIQRLWNEVLPTSPLFVPNGYDLQVQSRVLSPKVAPQDLTPLKGTVMVESSDKNHAPMRKRTRATKSIVISDDDSEGNPSTTMEGPRQLNAQDVSWSPPSPSAERKQLSDGTGDEASQPPPKRSRQEGTYEGRSRLNIPARPPLVAKKYGKKGQISSPIPNHDIDFDELPAPSTDHHGQSSDLHKLQGKISAMKRRGDKRPPKLNRVAVSSTKPIKEKKETGPSISLKVPQEEILHPQIIDDDEKPSRRSARVARLKASGKATTPEIPRIVQPDKTNPREKSPDPSITNSLQLRTSLQQTKKTAQGFSVYEEDLLELSPVKQPSRKPRTAPWAEKDFIKFIAPSAAPSNDKLFDDVLGQKDIEPWDPVESDTTFALESPTRDACLSAQEDYYEPIRAGSTSLDIPIPDNDVVIIDLTNDSPKPVPKLTFKDDDCHNQSPPTNNMNSRHISPERLRPAKLPTPSPPTALAAPAKSGPSRVAFAINHTYHEHVPSSRTTSEILFPPRRNATPPVLSPPFNQNKNIGRRQAHNSTFADKAVEHDKHSYRVRKSDLDPTSRIIDVIGKITQIIVQNTSKRFDNVRNELRAGQMSILLETANDLEKMRTEGIDHFNNLVDLEAEYASHRRRIVDGFEDLVKASQDVSQSLTVTIQEHNRSSLSRKFSNTLFSSSLPAILLNPKLVV